MSKVTRKVKITVPCSSANIGPGFDVLGLTLSMFLTLDIEFLELPQTNANTATDYTNETTLDYTGEGSESISLKPTKNLITKTALYVLACHNIFGFPVPLHIHVNNSIPMGRGLGSSGAAVVAGVLLGNVVGNLSLSKDRLLDFTLMVERHPDNVTAALMGGFVASYLRELEPKDTEAKNVPHSEESISIVGGNVFTDNNDDDNKGDDNTKPRTVPLGIGHYIRLGWAKEIKAITIMPKFEVATATARSVLPNTYQRKDVVFNLQRLAVLTTALAQSPPDPDLIFQAMQDKVHQPYRKTLIPGLSRILSSVTPKTHPGLVGICLSGAGPTILALATHNFDVISSAITLAFLEEDIETEVNVLEITESGAVAEEVQL
ncbi:13004_t:CDS:2 [Ambispora leptoticha]|uniref:Homoserine kinase n=1 Tax=Ambispora leptoticha TaxID=144679 RepID=A0A9N8W3H2_9GLOM|nr:13004_t:CDS:2 [Ambispora leptoticha]